MNPKEWRSMLSTWSRNRSRKAPGKLGSGEVGLPRAIAYQDRWDARIWLISIGLFLSNQWLNSILVHSFGAGDPQMCKLDCYWYLGIAQNGYTAVDPGLISYEKMQNWAFFPLFPAAVKLLLESTQIRPDTATTLMAKVFFFLSIFSFIKLGKLYLRRASSLTLGFVAAFNPYSIYGNSGYSEPLFLMLTCLFFFFLKQRNYLLSGAIGFFLPLARLVGIASFASMGLSILLHKQELSRRNVVAGLVALTLIPMGLILFMVHLHHQTGDALAFIHIQKAWRGSEHSLRPWSWASSLLRGFSDNSLWLYPYWALTGLITVSVCIFLLARGDDKFKPLALFSLICTMLPLSSDTWGLARYIWWQAPVLLGVCGLIQRCSRQKMALSIWAAIAIVVNIYCYRQWFTPLKWYIS